jgi:HAE1 family hydrophobic/amphiphilic exporter-1
MVHLSAPFIKRPVMTTLVMATLLFLGIIALRSMPVSDLPSVDYPTIKISTGYPGASAETVASNVTAILEREFTTVDGVNFITSQSSLGSSTIVLQFNLDKPIEDAAVDVQAAINQAQARLPGNLPSLPTYTKVNPAASPVLYLAVTSSTATLYDLYNYSDLMIGRRLNMINGVAEVDVYGSPYAVRVRVDPRKLAVRGIGIDELATSIQSQNVLEPVGTLYGSSREFALDMDGQLEQATAYNELIIRQDNGTITRIRDVGYAMDGVQFDKYTMRYLAEGEVHPCCILAVYKQANANTMNIINGVREALGALDSEIPGSIQIKTIFDRGVYIAESIHDVAWTLVIALILVLLVIFLYLGELVATIIPACVLPITVIATFAIMAIYHFNIDILSMLAITLSIGFLIDDAIVVLENIKRHTTLGKSPMQAALDGAQEISFTVVSMTLCLASVFIPLLFMEGIIGRLFHEFSLVIIGAILLSGIISLSLTPMMSARFIQPRHQESKKSTIERWSDRVNDRLLGWYRPLLHIAISHKGITLGIGLCSIIATVALLSKLPKDFLPPDDLGFIQGFTEMEDGTSPFMMEDEQNTLLQTLCTHPAIEAAVSMAAKPQDNQGIFFLRLKPPTQRAPIQTILSELTAHSRTIPGLKVFYKPLPLINLQIGPSSAQANYQYSLQSLNSETLYPAAEKLLDAIKTIPGVVQVNSDMHLTQPRYAMRIRRDKAAMMGVTAEAIENALNLAYANTQLSSINMNSNQYYVILETLPEFYGNTEAIGQLWIRSQTTNQLVPLSTLIDAEDSVSPLTVNHINSLPAVTITFDVQGVPLSTALSAIYAAAKNILPENVIAKVQGTANVFETSFANLEILLVIMVFVIYVILGILYENFIHPLTVMSTLPMAALGGIISLVIFGYPLSLYALVGLIMLLGIVMKNGIIMVDFANDRILKEHKPPHEAIVEACLIRFRPILMTTAAALMGAVPVALGLGGLTALSRKPLGIVIVGGLLFSQVLTLFVTPVLFIILENLRQRKRTAIS